ncbi:pancreatic triacylglycerol lipase-like [Cimex lectularius]|uniref:Lipase domain-containing protein n=1 Tax=Cimex lectularius TaxID=79782 RepID=A0A8I6S6L7_CIMLE|nr:pancreatic triacylglycerol lipase-like [Cimex lectularius]
MYNHTGSVLLQTAMLLAVTNASTGTTNRWTNTISLADQGKYMKDVCYDGVGCFSVNAPWVTETRPVSNFPHSPEQIDPDFCLYTRKERDTCHRLFYDKPSTFANSTMIRAGRTFLISHGFLEHGGQKWIKLLKRRLLNVSDSNVIVVGWQGGSNPPYTQAVADTRVVGTMAALLLNALHKEMGIRPEECHAIGHSLGAHLNGYIGHVLKSRFGLTLGRISALDPAKPHFSKTDPVVRLDPTDALFVDVIHTDNTPFIQGGLGLDEPIGHLDFYPNGGLDQPGCNKSVGNYMEMDWTFIKAFRRVIGCNHVRSYEYFIESLYDRCDFLAVECESYSKFLKGECFNCKSALKPDRPECARMGFFASENPPIGRSQVKLYTITGAKKPYCRALYKLTFRISSSEESRIHKGEVGYFKIKIVGVQGETESITFLKEMTHKPGDVHTQAVAASQVGRVKSAKVTFIHSTTLFLFTWRVSVSTIHLESVTVENLTESSGIRLCPVGGELLLEGKQVDMQPCGKPIMMEDNS